MDKWKKRFLVVLGLSIISYGILLPPVITNIAPPEFYSRLFSGADKGGEILTIKADPENGFDYDYLLFIPDLSDSKNRHYLLVEPNNTGSTSDDYEKHYNEALNDISFGFCHKLGTDLKTPVLMPVFPRPATDWQIYTHSLDRDSIFNDTEQYRRFDRQLIKMVTHARGFLSEKGYEMEDSILLNGFSASGSFVNRFTALYPRMVKAVASGGINAMPILPIHTFGDTKLIYPIGISENLEITGEDFDSHAYSMVDQYLYMGESDRNDTFHYDDAFNSYERDILSLVFKEDMRARWELSKEIYRPYDKAIFRLYEGIGHTLNDEIYEDCLDFFRGY